MLSCSCGCSNSGGRETIASDNFNKMNQQIDKALAKGDYQFAFEVLNSIPSHFDEDARFYYNPKSGEMVDISYSGDRDREYTYEQHNRKAVSVFKAEGDVLFSKDNIEAENLFLEHLADYDLGVSTVDINDSYAYCLNNDRYRTAVTIYNDYLVSVVRKALVKNKPELAKKVSKLIRDGLSFKRVDGEDGVWYYDTEAKDEAKEIIDSFEKD